MKRETSQIRTPRRQRRERGSISAPDIVDGAFALAAEITVEKLSMPLLARRLDVGVTSIYWYFRSKDALLEAMRERAIAQYDIALPFTSRGPWNELLREHFRAMRTLFQDNPVLCDLLIANTSVYGDNPTRVANERLETVVTELVGAGFTPRDALDTYFSLAAHSRGFALLERQQNLEAAEPPGADRIDRDVTPTLGAIIDDGYEFRLTQERIFDLGLDALIERAENVLRRTTLTDTAIPRTAPHAPVGRPGTDR
ncbi:TetR/AcrR family transcriptional regulator [Nocardia bovistercoris]|uniref:TetR/AcrR family transcriptional regulator n=1 Tax=Nocardia bovistercoris TaxID=2785916 RepID=A0A931IHU7_9NOCA|nr:TetR/AcrR family transcriptional regulator [Nocardia bovistercoris]